MTTTVQHIFKHGREGHEHSPQCRCEPRKDEVVGEKPNGEKSVLIGFIHGKLEVNHEPKTA